MDINEWHLPLKVSLAYCEMLLPVNSQEAIHWYCPASSSCRLLKVKIFLFTPVAVNGISLSSLLQ